MFIFQQLTEDSTSVESMMICPNIMHLHFSSNYLENFSKHYIHVRSTLPLKMPLCRLSNDCMSVLQDLIPEAIPNEKRHMNTCPILSGYGDTGLWNVACEIRHGHVHWVASAQITLQLPNSTVRLCSHTCRYIIRLWTCRLDCHMKNMRICNL
jgi:hypothetical protein